MNDARNHEPQNDAPQNHEPQNREPQNHEPQNRDTAAGSPPPAAAAADKDRILAEWTAGLTATLGLAPLAVDIDQILALAGDVAHSVLRPAAPLTTFLVGYAAGRATALSQVIGDAAASTGESADAAADASPEAAIARATETARRLALRRNEK